MLANTTDKAALCDDDAELLQAIFQGKWRFRVLQEIVQKPIRLSGLRRAIPECSKKVLIDTLHALETLKIVERVAYETRVKKVEYHLSSHCADSVRRLIESVDRRKVTEA